MLPLQVSALLNPYIIAELETDSILVESVTMPQILYFPTLRNAPHMLFPLLNWKLIKEQWNENGHFFH